MATFQSQIEGLTNLTLTTTSTPSTTQVDQFLNDGVIDFTTNYLKAFPAEGAMFARVSAEATSNPLDVNSASILSVVRESGVNDDWRVCRKSFPGMEAMLQDKQSIHYASKVNPAYIQVGDNISVYPSPDANENAIKVYYVNNEPQDGSDGALTVADSTIANFPSNKVYLIVVYAAMKAIEAKMAEYTVSEEDPELMESYAANLQVLRGQYYQSFGSQQQQGGGNEN